MDMDHWKEKQSFVSSLFYSDSIGQSVSSSRARNKHTHIRTFAHSNTCALLLARIHTFTRAPECEPHTRTPERERMILVSFSYRHSKQQISILCKNLNDLLEIKRRLKTQFNKTKTRSYEWTLCNWQHSIGVFDYTTKLVMLFGQPSQYHYF